MTLLSRENTPDNASLIGIANLRRARTSRPTVMEKGIGIFLFDENGREYIEGCSSFYRAALSPLPNARVAFASTGSEANGFLLKFMRFRNATLGERQRINVIARVGSFHGGTIATAALGGFPGTAAAFNLPTDDVILVSQPDYVNAALPGETEEEFTARMLAEIEAAILKAGAETVGARILEPVSYSAGCVLPPRGYMVGLRRLLTAHGVLLFDDEVICGFGRTGSLFGAQTFGMQPDCITIACMARW
jgi:4-aminobutyrate--pyruvate transaminase